jgi:DNA-binding NarL/FixJ family response regulator
MTVRLLIADDSADARAAIRALLARDATFEVVGEARDGYEALRLADELRPDVVLMDLAMPGCDGLLATRLIKRRRPQVTVVVLTVSEDAADLFEAIRSGAQGYLLKSLAPGDWLDYLRGLVRGDVPVPRRMAERILAELRVAPRAPAPIEVGLTDREAEVLRLVTRALTNRQIGEHLGISEQTVKNHLKHMVQKLRLRNRVDLAMYAKERGLDRA